jgi:small-conductance mechanosensitive channel
MRFFRKVKGEPMKQLFETRSHSWVDAGLAKQLSKRALRRARIQILFAAPLLAGILFLYSQRGELRGGETPIQIVTVVALLMLGYALIRDLGRLMAPALFRRMDPATAGTVGFLIRLAGVVAILAVALRIAGLGTQQLAVGGAFTAIIAGLAAQQTLGNLFAGLVLLSARPFRVGDRVKLLGAGIDIEGVVSSLGLLYTTFDQGENTTMVPNSSVLNVAVTPLREPDSVDMRARLPAAVTPSQVEAMIREHVETPLRGRPDVELVELDGDELVVQISATPRNSQDGAHLASEVLEVVSREAIRGANGARN